MAETNTNNQENVSSAKGVKGGYIFSAPVGTALPTDIKTALDPAFKCLGFISEDGYVETVDEDSDDIPDMNGDIMDSSNSNRVESAQFTLAEIKQLDAGAWFDPKFAGTRIPTFKEAIASMKGKTGIYVELKLPERYAGIEAKMRSKFSI